jgi:Raf kinase inhibitor-like YbhB/YbcL family protein
MVGIGILVIVGGLYFINHPFMAVTDNSSESVIPNTHTSMPNTLTLSSSVFRNDGPIPARYTCDGEQVNPPLTMEGLPAGTKSLVLLMNDPDVPKAVKEDGNFDHWVLFNIPPSTSEITPGMMLGTLGANGAGKSQYTGPCPPAQYEPSTHRYFFKLYALDVDLDLTEGASKSEVEHAMKGHVMAEAQLVGMYKRK